MAADTELDDAIANAADEILKDVPAADKQKIIDKNQPKADEPAVDDDTDKTDDYPPQSDDEPAPDDLTADQLKEAQFLYKALLDPNQRVNIVAALAAQAGILGDKAKPIETPKEVARAKKDFIAILKEALPEYPALAERLAPVFESVLEEQREEQEQALQEVHLDRIQNTVDKSIERLRRETKGQSAKLENKMAELSSKIVMAPGGDIDEYVRNLYTIASAGSTKQKTSAELADRIRRNANNAADRIKGAPDNGKPVVVPNKKMSLNESVNFAIEELSKGRR